MASKRTRLQMVTAEGRSQASVNKNTNKNQSSSSIVNLSNTNSSSVNSEAITSGLYALNNSNSTLNSTSVNNNLLSSSLQMLKDPAKFNGAENEDYMAWLEDFNSYIDRFSISQESKLSIFRTSLGGSARTALDGFEQDEIDTYEKISKAFESVFAPEHEVSDWLKKLNNLTQNPDENIRVFAQRVRRHVQKALPDCTKELREKHVIVHFIKGLKTEISKKLQSYSFLTLADAIKKSIRCETEIKNRKPKSVSLNNIEFNEEEEDVDEDDELPMKVKKVSSIEIPKRNGGKQQITLFSLANEIKEQNKQLNQKIEDRFNQIRDYSSRCQVNPSSEYNQRHDNYQRNNSYNNNGIPRIHRISNSNYDKSRMNSRFKYQNNQDVGKMNISNIKSTNKPGSCFVCRQEGHKVINCPYVKHDEISNISSKSLN